MYELSQIRGARILLATENRWGTVNSQWEDALARSALEVVSGEITLPSPSRLPRPVILVELQAREDGKGGQAAQDVKVASGAFAASSCKDNGQ